MPQADRAQALYTAEQTRQLDRRAIEGGTPGFDLMLQAGRACYRALRRRWPDLRSMTVLCGTGNNGGDGLVIAALAKEQQLGVEVLMLGGDASLAKLQGEAKQALQWAAERGVTVQAYDSACKFSGELLVDALLGTGLSAEVRGDYAVAIGQINASGRPVVAVDIPSGLCADSGRIMGKAVVADLTVTLIGCKRGLMTNEGPQHRGALVFDSLNVSDAVYDQVSTSISLISSGDMAQWLPKRHRNAHKGSFGHLLVIGGDQGMGGAVSMAAEAGTRSGAGLVSVATRAEHVPAIVARRPELMAKGVRSGQELESMLARAGVLVIGPGLGQSAWSGQLLHQAQQYRLPMVVDADGLNLLGVGQLIDDSCRDNWVLTPHPGEAARLLDTSVAQIQADRFAAVKQLQQQYGGVVVLKGAGTLICDGVKIKVCAAGNPGMASGGMGDVLAGTIGGLLAQGFTPMSAASAAVQAHSCAADLCAGQSGERGMLATDLIEGIRRQLNPDLRFTAPEQQA